MLDNIAIIWAPILLQVFRESEDDEARFPCATMTGFRVVGL